MTFGLKNVFEFDATFYNGYIKLREGPGIYHGFRTEPFDLQKPANEYRIVALGGSSTYNLSDTGSDGYKSSWPYFLQRDLNDNLHDYNYKVINAGIPRQTTTGVDRLLSEEIFSMDPDLVIIYSLYNHVFLDDVALYGKGKIANRIFRIFQWLFHNKSLAGTYLIEKLGLYSLPPTLRNKFQTYQYLLTDMVRKCDQHKVKIIIVKQLINPKYFIKSRNYNNTRADNEFSSSQYFDFMKIIDETCGKLDCVVVDFSASSPACKNKMDKILLDAVHPSRYGNEVLAELIYKKFVELKGKKFCRRN